MGYTINHINQYRMSMNSLKTSNSLILTITWSHFEHIATKTFKIEHFIGFSLLGYFGRMSTISCNHKTCIFCENTCLNFVCVCERRERGHYLVSAEPQKCHFHKLFSITWIMNSNKRRNSEFLCMVAIY